MCKSLVQNRSLINESLLRITAELDDEGRGYDDDDDLVYDADETVASSSLTRETTAKSVSTETALLLE